MKSIFIHQQFDTFSWSRRFQFPHSLQVSWYDTLSPTSYYLIGPRPCLTSTTSRSRRTRAKSDGPTHIPSPNVALFALYSRFHYSWRITEALSQRRRKGGGKGAERRRKGGGNFPRKSNSESVFLCDGPEVPRTDKTARPGAWMALWLSRVVRNSLWRLVFK